MLNGSRATGTALLRPRFPTARAVIIYTVSLPIENLHYPRHPFKDAEKMVQSVSGFAKFLQPLYCFSSAEKFSGNTVASVTPHSSIPGAKKILYQPPYSQHTPKTLEFHRQRFSVCFWRVLKIPKQGIFCPPSIPLSFPPPVTVPSWFSVLES